MLSLNNIFVGSAYDGKSIKALPTHELIKVIISFMGYNSMA